MAMNTAAQQHTENPITQPAIPGSIPAGQLLEQTVQIVSSYVYQNELSQEELTGLLRNVHTTLQDIAQPQVQEEVAKQKPAVNPKKSVHHDYIICLEDGKKLKMLKRYISTRFNLTPDEYREKWGLAKDYPMVAPSYADQRREVAQRSGLGRGASGGRRKKRA